MAETLALLSGKGGSGKTSLALSMATMLSRCEIRVLLIDCDLSTNGATYFFESKLIKKNREIDSFSSLFVNCSEYDCKRIIEASRGLKNTLRFVKINEYMEFMPSITQIKNSRLETQRPFSPHSTRYLFRYLNSAYDVIIFDCQAGYTDNLEVFLPYIDINLVVMETDAISSAAIRSFYLKVGHLINDRKLYQVFNKATSEEYEIYSKLSGGTVFTNIETILFDWKIRKAFAVSQIPDMESTSAYYGEQIYNICKVLFRNEEIQNKLKAFADVIEINKLIEQEKNAKEELNQLSKQKSKANRFSSKFIFPLLSCVLLVIVFLNLIVYFEGGSLFNPSLIMVELMVVVIPFYALFLSDTIFVIGDNRSRSKRSREIYEELERLSIEKKKIQEKIKPFPKQ